MIKEKGLPSETADKIGEYVQLNGREDLIEKLLSDTRLSKSKSAIEGLEALKLILKYCKIYGTYENVSFDLSLARGLDYYTGIIYEAVLLRKRNFSLHNNAYINIRFLFSGPKCQRWYSSWFGGRWRTLR